MEGVSMKGIHCLEPCRDIERVVWTTPGDVLEGDDALKESDNPSGMPPLSQHVTPGAQHQTGFPSPGLGKPA